MFYTKSFFISLASAARSYAVVKDALVRVGPGNSQESKYVKLISIIAYEPSELELPLVIACSLLNTSPYVL